jgi:hypothetical protein
LMPSITKDRISQLMSFTSAAETAAHWGRQVSRRVDLSANNRFS